MATFTDGFGGDVQTYIDTYLDLDNGGTNYGGQTWLQLHYKDVDSQVAHDSLLKFTLGSLAGSTVTSATLYLYELGWGAGAYTAGVYRILVANSAWTEADSTWDHEVDGVSRWAGDAGGDGGNDAGCSVSGTDYNAASMGTLNGDGDNVGGTEYAVSLNIAQVQAMIDDADYGLILIPTDTNNATQFLASSDHGTGGWRPKLTIEYHAPRPPAAYFDGPTIF